MFFIFSYRVQAEQMVSGSNIFSLGGPESAYLKGEEKMREKGGGGRGVGVKSSEFWHRSTL